LVCTKRNTLPSAFCILHSALIPPTEIGGLRERPERRKIAPNFMRPSFLILDGEDVGTREQCARAQEGARALSATAIGGSTGYSDWSDPVSHRSL
jgi:hypothetical protein